MKHIFMVIGSITWAMVIAFGMMNVIKNISIRKEVFTWPHDNTMVLRFVIVVLAVGLSAVFTCSYGSKMVYHLTMSVGSVIGIVAIRYMFRSVGPK